MLLDLGQILYNLAAPSEGVQPIAVEKSKYFNGNTYTFANQSDKLRAIADQYQALDPEVRSDPRLVGTTTHSMLGSGIDGGTVIPVKADNYTPQDLVIYPNWKGGNNTGIHVITATKPDAVYTKGTFNQRGDGWTALANLVGKVNKVYKQK